MENAIIYCRVSTEEQAEDGHHSLSAQESICRKVASERGYEIIRIFRDPGKSATNMNRPGLRDALLLCQTNHSIKALFVQDTDRLARNTQDHLAIRAILKKSGIKLISASQPMLEDSAEGNMIDTIIASVNQFQSDITSRKTLKGLEEKVRKGGWPCQAPLGYKNVGKGEGDKERVIAIDPDTAPMVKRMFKLYATGNYSMHQLRDMLYSEGLRSRNGKKLHVSKVHTILQNPFYIGIVRWSGIEVTGQHQPLVDPPLFDAVDTVLQANGGQRGRRRKHEFLLRGYAFCARCGRQLIGECHINKRAAYYRCHKRGGCGPATPVNDLEQEVMKKFNEVTPSLSFTNMVIASLKSRLKKDHDGVEAEATRLQNRKIKTEDQLLRLEQKWLEKIITDQDFSRIKDRLNKELKAIEGGLNELKWKVNTNIDEVEEVLKFTNRLGLTYKNSSVTVKRMLLRFAWERFEVKKNQITNANPTILLKALYSASRQSQNSLVKERVLSQCFGGAPVLVTGDPIQPYSNKWNDVRIRTEWGPGLDKNRTQKMKKVAGQSNYSSLTLFFNLIKDAKYMAGLLELYRAIKQALKDQKIEPIQN